MKNSYFALVLFALLLPVFAFSQKNQPEENDFGIKLSGFVKVDYFFDSRQTVAAREGHFLLFPKGEMPDADNKDINATPSFNILAIQTRLKGSITGPDFFGAKTAGVIEGAFFGQSNADINGFRLRHAFVKLGWEKIDLLMGQYWHPMFVTSVFPHVYSFNTGAPFQPFSRNPQIRLTIKTPVRIIATLYGQRDFSSRGPLGASSSYMRQSGIPGMDLQFQYAGTKLFGGVGFDYKFIKPELMTSKGYKCNTIVGSYAAIAFLKFKSDDFCFKLESTYGQNMADQLMLGGIATTSIEEETGRCEYASVSVFSVWSEFSTSFSSIEAGIFGGYTKNMGIESPLAGAAYTLGGNIANIWRLSPRIAWQSGKMKIGMEMETTAAQYGKFDTGSDIVVTNETNLVTNYRLLVFGLYKF